MPEGIDATALEKLIKTAGVDSATADRLREANASPATPPPLPAQDPKAPDKETSVGDQGKRRGRSRIRGHGAAAPPAQRPPVI